MSPEIIKLITENTKYEIWSNSFMPFFVQVRLNKLECREKVFFFLIFLLLLISKSETFIYFRLIACKEKKMKVFFVFILKIRAYRS